jgi:glycosyltransferase involved in cell wall biosynthesis
MRYCLLYLKTKNVNLIKDMGMIPYKLHKNHGFDSTIATYDYEEFTYLKDEVKGLKLDIVERKYNNFTLDGMRYLRKNAKEIDVLQVFHVTLYSVFYAFTYKLLNPKGKLYIKLDCSYKLVERIEGLNFWMFKFLNAYLSKADLISVEQKALYEILIKLLPKQKSKLINIPNGVDYDYLDRVDISYDFSAKEDIILQVARVGAPEKNTELLLEAFKRIKDIETSTWKLVLVGPVEKGFEAYLKKYFEENPALKQKVILRGNIIDRKKIFEEYKRAKIFCLSSDFESFGIALIEAAALGDVIVTTDVGIAKELVEQKNGAVVPVKDANSLAEALSTFIKAENLDLHSYNTYRLCKEKFDWNDIIEKLNSRLL